MGVYDNLCRNLDIAILEGIVTFGNNEGRFCKEISYYYNNFKISSDVSEQNTIVSQYLSRFETFAKVFKVIRNIDSNTNNRYKLINIIFNEYLPSISHDYIPEKIDAFSEMANSLGLTHGKATSAFSKIAFLYRPDLYFPYDKTARQALQNIMDEKRMKVSIDRNYSNYSKAIYLVFNEFDRNCSVRDYIINKRYLSSLNINIDLFNKSMSAFYENCKALNILDVDEFIYRRAFDKSLMLYGGFNKSNLVLFTDGFIK